MKLMLISFFFSTFLWAQSPVHKTLYLNKEDQKFFQNDVNEGNNTFERININVKEINRLHGEIRTLKNELKILKEEVEKLKVQK